MRELSKEECAEVSGAGAFSFLKGVGFALAGGTVGFFLGGPAGAAVGFVTWGLGASTDAIYDAANEGRESKRVENYDYTK